MSQAMSFNSFISSTSKAVGSLDDSLLSFPNIGTVEFTTLTEANLSLLRRVLNLGYPGLLICCPDFEREAIAVSFLAALQHIECDPGEPGLHEARIGEKAAVGKCVVDITEVDEEKVMYRSCDQSIGILKQIRAFPPVHRAKADAKLSRTKNTKKRKYLSLIEEEDRYEALPIPQKRILDLCGKAVPSVGYASSPSQYANEAPTHLLGGRIKLGETAFGLTDVLPLTYLSPEGDERDAFGWPFDCPPSILIGPRVDGVASASQILDLVEDGGAVDFVTFNVSTPDLLNTSLLTDVLDLKDHGIGVIVFCDRWTLNRLQILTENGFLPFDWGNCDCIANVPGLTLSPIQNRIIMNQLEKVIPVSDENSGLFRAKQIFYDGINADDIEDDEVVSAVQDLFSVLGAAIRMTESPDKEYSSRQHELIEGSLDIIRASRLFSQDEFSEIRTACSILSAFFSQGNLTPKEKEIYRLITAYLKDKLPVVLVVDRNRTEAAYKYWCGKLSYNGYDTELFTVLTPREFLRGSALSGDEYVIFSGWYDKGTMDRCLHSGIATNMILVLYGHDGGDLELGWWLNAKAQWGKEEGRAALASDGTLGKLGIDPLNRPKPSKSIVSSRRITEVGAFVDEPPTSIVSAIEKRRIQGELAKAGEKSIPAVPVMFHDGSHVWLKADSGQRRGGRLLVITDCLTGRSDAPDQKPASALLTGDVVLRTHSDREYILRTSESSTEGYGDVMSMAQKWREPIRNAIRLGYSDSEIIDMIHSRVSKTRTKAGVRGWVKGVRIAPQTQADIEAIYSALNYPVTEGELEQIGAAVREIRNKHRAVGRMTQKELVDEFLKDVKLFGLDDALKGFDDRHESGDVELLRITAVGELNNVAVDRADVL